MKRLRSIFTTITLIAGGSATFAQGYLVPNGVTYGGYLANSGYRINVVDNPSGASSVFSTNTQFWLNPIGETPPTAYTNTFELEELTDIGVRVFLVSSNDAISLQPILAGAWTELDGLPSSVFTNNVPFYVALYTGYEFAPPYPPYPPYQYLGPVFGWAELENVNGSIEMLGGALEYGGAGIYAGTDNIIQATPEPGILGLSALGGLLFYCRRWKRLNPKP